MFGAFEESSNFYESFHLYCKRFCTENTLYFSLLVSRVWRDDPGRFDRLLEKQAQSSRNREWGHKFSSDDQRSSALEAVETHFVEKGARAMSRMPNGYDLHATLMRCGVPFEITSDTQLATNWYQVCQRVSQSEDGLARWEVVAADAEIAAEAKGEILGIVKRFGGNEAYQG